LITSRRQSFCLCNQLFSIALYLTSVLFGCGLSLGHGRIGQAGRTVQAPNDLPSEQIKRPNVLLDSGAIVYLRAELFCCTNDLHVRQLLQAYNSVSNVFIHLLLRSSRVLRHLLTNRTGLGELRKALQSFDRFISEKLRTNQKFFFLLKDNLMCAAFWQRGGAA